MTAFYPTIKRKIRALNAKSKRRRLRFLIAVILLLFAALLLLPTLVLRGYAEGGEGAQEELNAAIDELIASLNTEELQEYLNGLTEFEGVTLKDKLKSMLSGDLRLDYPSIWNAAFSFALREARTMLPAFAVILAVSLLCGVLNSAKNGFLNSTMSDIINFVGYLSVGAVVLACLTDVVNSGFTTAQHMKKQTELVYPVLLTLMAASGGATSVAVFRPAVAFFSGAVCSLFTNVVMPVAVVVIVLAFLSNLSPDVHTERLGDFFKSISKWLIGLTLGIFSLFLTVQGITAAQYDGMSLRAAKYVISGSVPVVGGFLSGGVDLVVAGSVIIKNALGSFAIFLLASVMLKNVLLFASFQLFLRLGAAACEPAGGKTSAFLSRLAGDSGYFIAGVLCIGFLYFLTLLLFLCSTGVIFS